MPTLSTSFLHGWALAIGAAALGLPLLIHLLARPARRRMPLPTIRFLRATADAQRRRSRLRDHVVLVLRTLTVALIALAFARPLIGSSTSIAASTGETNVTRVVLLDVSQSMAAIGADNATALDRARPIVDRQLRYEPGLRASLIIAGARPRAVFDTPTTNLAALRSELANARVQPERLNVADALAAAAQTLASAPAGSRRELTIVSDFQRADWADIDFAGLPVETTIDLQTAADALEPANLAVEHVASRARLESGQPFRIAVTVANHSGARRSITVDLTLAERHAVQPVDIPAHGSATALFTLPPRAAGWVAGEARLLDANDALPADDVRPIACRIFPPPAIALLTRESAVPAPTSSHFIELALVPIPSAAPITRMPADAIDVDALSRADFIVLDHPGGLGRDAVSRIAERVRRGGAGLLYVAAEPVDAVNLESIAVAAEADWDSPVTFLARSDADDAIRRIAAWRADAPGLSLMTDSAAAAMRPLQLRGALDTRPRAGGLADDVAMTYADGSAALVLSHCGAGYVAVLNADLARSNLIAAPLFVPLVGEVESRLLAARQQDLDARPAGEPISIALDADAPTPDRITIDGPSLPDGASAGAFIVEAGRTWFRWPHAGPAGVYRILDGTRVVHAFAVAAPPEESALAAIDPAALVEHAKGRATIHVNVVAADAIRTVDRLWTWIALAALALAAVELCVVTGVPKRGLPR